MKPKGLRCNDVGVLRFCPVPRVCLSLRKWVFHVAISTSWIWDGSVWFFEAFFCIAALVRCEVTGFSSGLPNCEEVGFFKDGEEGIPGFYVSLLVGRRGCGFLCFYALV